MKNPPLVSILINNYNYGCFLKTAINSALAQTYKELEIIIVDDGSTDNSLEIINSYGDRIISIVKENAGQASAFNAGFSQSHGEIICFLDADDLFVPTKVEKIVEAFNFAPEVGWCFHPLEFVDRNLESLTIEQKFSGKSGVYNIRDDIKQGKLNGRLPFSSIATSGLCYRRSLLEKLLPMPESIKITSDDYLKYAAFALTPGYALLEKLSWQKIHDNNAYTFRNDKEKLRAKINITTASLLRQKIPYIKKFTNNIFSLGFATYQPKSQQEPEIKLLIEDYWSKLQTAEKIEIKLRSLYYQYRK